MSNLKTIYYYPPFSEVVHPHTGRITERGEVVWYNNFGTKMVEYNTCWWKESLEEVETEVWRRSVRNIKGLKEKIDQYSSLLNEEIVKLEKIKTQGVECLLHRKNDKGVL